MQHSHHSGFKLAIVGASTLKGKELKEVLEQRAFPAGRLALLDDQDLRGQLTEFQGEATFVRSIERDSFEGVEFAFFAGDAAFTRNVWKLADREGCSIIDLTGALEGEAADAVVAGPAATGEMPSSQGRVYISAHPAAVVIVSILRRLAAHFPLRRAIVNIFEPASERGASGVEELQQQTVNLLSFHEAPKKVFGDQLAFNLLASYGEEIRPTLADVEERVARHIARLGQKGVPTPSVRVLQSPAFHAHSFSFYLELDEERPAEELERAFAGGGYDLRRCTEEAPSAVGAASSSEIVVGDIRADKSFPRGYWLWAAADNLRLMAVNAVQIAENLAKVKQA